MTRLEPIHPSELDPEQKSLYDCITEGPRAQGPKHFDLTRDDGALLGPFNAMLLSPHLGSALQELGGAVRFRTGLSARTREIAILTVATCWNSPFERTCAHLVRSMVEGDVDDEAWANWAHVVGTASVFELTTLVGSYATLA